MTGREGGARSFAHPALGLLSYDQTTFAVAGRPDLKLVVLTPAPDPVSPAPRRRSP